MSNDPDLIDRPMQTYRVLLTTTASHSVLVEAETVEDAINAAEMEGAPSLCHHCARAADLGDWIADEDDVEEVDE